MQNNIDEKIFEQIDFNVKGITFKNEEGKDIQDEIRKTLLEYERYGSFEKYGGYTNEEIKEFVNEVAEFEDAEIEIALKEDVYEEKPCIKVYLKKYNNSYYHIGYMPKDLVKKYLKLKKDFKEYKISANLVGGKIKQLEYDVVTDKEKVEIVDLDYGVEVSLIFYNDKNKFQMEVEKKKQKAIDEWNKSRKEQELKRQEEQSEFERKQRNMNIRLFILISIISAPFIWLFWKILSFLFWLLE